MIIFYLFIKSAQTNFLDSYNLFNIKKNITIIFSDYNYNWKNLLIKNFLLISCVQEILIYQKKKISMIKIWYLRAHWLLENQNIINDRVMFLHVVVINICHNCNYRN